jgi:hypothetical protein
MQPARRAQIFLVSDYTILDRKNHDFRSKKRIVRSGAGKPRGKGAYVVGVLFDGGDGAFLVGKLIKPSGYIAFGDGVHICFLRLC